MQNRGKKSLKTNSSLSSLPVTGNKGPSQFRLFVVLALVSLFAIGGVYSYFKVMKSMEFSPQKLFEETFSDPVSAVTELKGDSKSYLGFDSWIRFKSDSPVHLIKDKEFKPYIAEVGRTFFSEKYPSDQTLRQSVNHYEYVVRAEHPIGKVVNEGLLINKNTHEYFFRTWGM